MLAMGELKIRGNKQMKITNWLGYFCLIAIVYVAPAIAQSTFVSDKAGEGALSFPDFDYQKECEKIGQPHPPRQGGDTTMLINSCLDEETASRKSAEYKWFRKCPCRGNDSR